MEATYPHNVRVLRRVIHTLPVWACLFAIGCSTASRPTAFRPRVPDWEAEDIAPKAQVEAGTHSTTQLQSESINPAPAMVLPKAGNDPAVPKPSLRTESQPHETWLPLVRWSQANELPTPTRTYDPAGIPRFAINSTNGTFALTAGSKVVYWQGTELRLGFAPVLIDGQPYIHRLDLAKTLQPLLKRPTKNPVTRTPDGAPTIVIDPGHGGQNAGTHSIASRYYEKDYTLDWARRLQAMLIERGWNALLTRSNDFDLALSNRVAFADQHRADVFVSLHFNSAFPDHTQSGLETYCLTPAGMPSTVTRGFSDELSETFPNNAFDAENLLLATAVHEALLPAIGNRDRGVRRARFPGVLRNQHCPAILIEGGYLSNPQEARKIDNPGFRQKLAQAVAEALAGKPVPGTAQASSVDWQISAARPATP